MVRALVLALLAAGCSGKSDETGPTPQPADEATYPPSKIGFGSCSDQNLPMTILDAIVAAEPELYLWLGDNVYADTLDIELKRTAYDALGALPGFQALDAQAEFLATWDDHDYGDNDAGGE